MIRLLFNPICCFFCVFLLAERANCADFIGLDSNASSFAESPSETCDHWGNGNCSVDDNFYYSIEVDTFLVNELTGEVTYRVYLNTIYPDDFVSAVFGSETLPLHVNTSDGFNNHPLGGPTGWHINESLFSLVPELEADSWVTIGVSNASEGSQVNTIESSGQPWIAAFTEGSAMSGQNFEVSDINGGGWYVLGNTTNGIPDDEGRVLLMQLTTSGTLEGQFNVQVFEHGDGENEVIETIGFSGAGLFWPANVPICGCTDSAACNFNPLATLDDASCFFPSALTDCSGECFNDLNGNGVCDELEEAANVLLQDTLNAILDGWLSGGLCGEGTVWQSESQRCIPIEECLGDFNGDGARGTEDLVLFLTVFGTFCDPVESQISPAEGANSPNE